MIEVIETQVIEGEYVGPTADDLIRRMRNLVSVGWVQGVPVTIRVQEDGTTRVHYCLIGSMREALMQLLPGVPAQVGPYATNLIVEAKRKLCEAICEGRNPPTQDSHDSVIVAFNDMLTQTQDNVLKMLDKAARGK